LKLYKKTRKKLYFVVFIKKSYPINLSTKPFSINDAFISHLSTEKNICIEKGFIKEKSRVTDMLYTCVLNAGYLIKRLRD